MPNGEIVHQKWPVYSAVKHVRSTKYNVYSSDKSDKFSITITKIF